MSVKAAEASDLRAASPVTKKTSIQLLKEVAKNGTEAVITAASGAGSAVATSGGAAISTSTAHQTSVEINQSTTVVKTTLAEACFQLKISQVGILTGLCLKWNGTRVEASFDVNEYIGNIDGRLVWDSTKYRNFKDSCTDLEIIDGFILRAKCRTRDGKDWIVSTFDLSTRLRIHDGRIVIINFDEKFTKMFTEVPWMKFKVVAEPDFSVLAGQTVVRDTMIKIATSTVQHVTVEMEAKIRAAIALAIQEVTASATQYIQTELNLALRQTSTERSAQINPSCTYTQPLHQMISQDLIAFKDIYSQPQASQAAIEYVTVAAKNVK